MEDSAKMNYAEEAFIYIDDSNKNDVIYEFSKDIIYDNFYGEDYLTDYDLGEMIDANLDKCINIIVAFLNKIKRPFTIVQEEHHIDASYRDSFYHYYSNQHFKTKRYSRRLSFFNEKISREMFFSEERDVDDHIKRVFMGSCVINPLLSGVIGRTLIHPQYMADFDEALPVYMRLSEFTINVYGKSLTVSAFPYRMQDEETM